MDPFSRIKNVGDMWADDDAKGGAEKGFIDIKLLTFEAAYRTTRGHTGTFSRANNDIIET